MSTYTIAAAELNREHLRRTVAFTWSGTQLEAPLLGFTRNEVALEALMDHADANLPVQLLIDTGVALGPQWFDVDERCPITLRMEAV